MGVTVRPSEGGKTGTLPSSKKVREVGGEGKSLLVMQRRMISV